MQGDAKYRVSTLQHPQRGVILGGFDQAALSARHCEVRSNLFAIQSGSAYVEIASYLAMTT